MDQMTLEGPVADPTRWLAPKQAEAYGQGDGATRPSGDVLPNVFSGRASARFAPRGPIGQAMRGGVVLRSASIGIAISGNHRLNARLSTCTKRLSCPT
jgi:hypothetical protein